jgi:hypothetical protein
MDRHVTPQVFQDGAETRRPKLKANEFGGLGGSWMSCPDQGIEDEE